MEIIFKKFILKKVYKKKYFLSFYKYIKKFFFYNLKTDEKKGNKN
jgi:hypothetical protein